MKTENTPAPITSTDQQKKPYEHRFLQYSQDDSDSSDHIPGIRKIPKSGLDSEIKRLPAQSKSLILPTSKKILFDL